MAKSTKGATRPNPTTPMCCLTIQHVEVLLPAEAGLKVAALLQGALRCEKTWERGYSGMHYVIGEPLAVEYCSVKPGDVRMPAPAPAHSDAQTLLLDHEPAKLTYGGRNG